MPSAVCAPFSLVLSYLDKLRKQSKFWIRHYFLQKQSLVEILDRTIMYDPYNACFL